METIEHAIELEVPVHTAYNQWTQFEKFPEFMEAVEEVRQVDDRRLHWVASVAGRRHEWDAEIFDQVPDQKISWRSVSGFRNQGTVLFDKTTESTTRVTVRIAYEPEGLIEKAGDALGMASARVKGDLKRFKEYVESRGHETGAWRGEIHGQKVAKEDETVARSKRLYSEPSTPGTTPGGTSGKM
jgi:uncharacterized membrane protein